jgi:Na+/melibiose symporter-like transporter
MKEKLPNSTASLVLGIFSIITCWCYGIPGIILGIIGFLQGKKAVEIHNEDPELYEGVGNAKAGKIISIIGVVLSIVVIGYVIWAINFIGLDALQDPELLQERLQELQNR